MALLCKKFELIKVLEKICNIELQLRWFLSQENASHLRAYNDKHIVSAFVWQVGYFLEEASGLSGEKLAGV